VRHRHRNRRLLTFLIGVVAIYGTVVVSMTVFQRQFLYKPNTAKPLLSETYLTDFTEVSFPATDGVQIYGWYTPAPEGAPTLLFFHGNAGHMGHRVHKLAEWQALGYGVLLVSYRGFGGAAGDPTEQGLYADASGALNWLQNQGRSVDQIIFYGESLGTGVAVELATRQPQVRAIVLEMPYTSVAQRAQEIYPLLPAYWLVRDRFDTLSKISGISAPLIILHGHQDEIMPFTHAQRLFEAASAPKTLIQFPEGTHSSLYDLGAAYQTHKALRAFSQKN